MANTAQSISAHSNIISSFQTVKIPADYPEYSLGITNLLKIGLNRLIQSVNYKLNARFHGSPNIPQFDSVNLGKIVSPENSSMSIELKAHKVDRVTTFPAEYQWHFMFDVTTIFKNVGDNSPEAFEMAKITVQDGLMYFFTNAETQNIFVSTKLWGNARIEYCNLLGGEDEEIHKAADEKTDVRTYVNAVEFVVSVTQTTS